MTETAFTTTATTPRLVRPLGTSFRGVCMALANYTGTDVVLWRVVFVVLLLFGGVGLPLYLLGIFLIPAEDEPMSLARRLVDGPDRHLSNRQVVFLAVLVLTSLGLLRNSVGAVVFLVAVGLTVLWWRGEPSRRVPATEVLPQLPEQQVPLTAPAPRPPRPRSPLGGVTAGLAVVTAGVLLLLDATGVTDVPADVVLASALGVIGLGLVIGSFYGRSVGLVLLALAVATGLVGTLASRPVLDDGLGDRSWTPTGSASYRLGVGDATLDLTKVPLREVGVVAIDAHVGVGRLLVLLPDGVRASVTAETNLGNVDVLGDTEGGRHVSRSVDLGPSGSPQLRLDLHVRTGDLEIRHA